MDIKEFWETAHKNNEELWLTGSYLNGVWSPMNLMNKLKSYIRILNIGVGLGRETMELKEKNVIVDVLDISETALNRVKNITRNQFLSENLNTLPVNEYDVIVSHLVTQHMSDNDLNEQLKYVIPSLNENGVFGMQFAFINDNDTDELNRVYNNVLTLEKEKKGHMFRTLDQMKKMIDENNGIITWVSDIVNYSHTPIKWYYINIMKK